LLELRNITKIYTTGSTQQIALDNLSISFRKQEFVAILGPSGSGKTTCLNIIGGLDRYDSGELIVNGTSTTTFSDAQWDAYRNNSIGFVFQNYNLIPHLSVLDNVVLGMALSGIPAAERKRRALELLTQVGLSSHVHKKPNQLSGGQMQRVAIARALANDPDIILADEPTGALDSATSEQILTLIKQIATKKLVIMVTHNTALAEKYADRIIQLQDGKLIADSNPYHPSSQDADYHLRMTGMSIATALKLSGTNIATKIWRTGLTALASSLGIIGIALILSLASGFQVHIDNFQRDALSEFPVIIAKSTVTNDFDLLPKQSSPQYPDTDQIYLYDLSKSSRIHTNTFTDEYLAYLHKIDPQICSSIGYVRTVGMNLLRRNGDNVFPVIIAPNVDMEDATGFSSMKGAGLSTYPINLGSSKSDFLTANYDLLAGRYPENETDLILIVDEQNRINPTVLSNLGIQTDGRTSIPFSEVVGLELKLIANNDYFIRTPLGNFLPRTDYAIMYDNPNNLTLTVCGILRAKPQVKVELLRSGIVYSDQLLQQIIAMNQHSKIVTAQKASDVNVLTLTNLNATTKQNLITYLGGDPLPTMILLFPNDFAAKNKLLTYLDAYNANRPSQDQILYTDLASTITELTGGIMNAITWVLIAFSAISLVVSLIMIGIITYISLLERTREIGVLRALGARKKDIARVFNAETFIIGTTSGILGIGIAYLLTIPINRLIFNLTQLKHTAQLQPWHALMLIGLSIGLALLGGAIPAGIAARKDPVEALRTEN